MASRKIMSTGVGESRLNRDPDAPPKNYLEGLEGLHFDGIPSEDIPQETLRYLRADGSDEARADRPAPIEVGDRGARRPRVRATATDIRKQMQERGDFLEEEDDASAAPDPRLDLVDQHVAPGMRPKFVSQKKLAKNGRDARGFEVVRDEKGEPVMHGTSVLAQMPEKKAEAMQRNKRRRSNELVEQVYQRAADKRMTPGEILDSAPPR